MHPSFPKGLRLVLVLATTAALLAFPIPALGAKGAELTADVNAPITTVSTDGLMAFNATFTNGNSTIAHLRFDGALRVGDTDTAALADATFDEGTAPCDGGGATVQCDLGNLAGYATVSLTLYFIAPSSDGVLTFHGSFSGDAAQGKDGSAKVDTWSDRERVTVNGSGDFFGSWQRSHSGQQTLQTKAISGNNHQSTQVKVPGFGEDYAASISETDDPTTCNGSVIDGVGQAVDLSIADGADVALVVTLRLDAVAAQGQTPGSIGLLHDCDPIPSNCRKNAGFCYDASWERNGRDKVLKVVVQLPHNGRLKII
ncbi:hypothetical protein BH23CHL10_BH23CHL10_06910 [soil metagenome]